MSALRRTVHRSVRQRRRRPAKGERSTTQHQRETVGGDVCQRAARRARADGAGGPRCAARRCGRSVWRRRRRWAASGWLVGARATRSVGGDRSALARSAERSVDRSVRCGRQANCRRRASTARWRRRSAPTRAGRCCCLSPATERCSTVAPHRHVRRHCRCQCRRRNVTFSARSRATTRRCELC